jgi:hypothetical protein
MHKLLVHVVTLWLNAFTHGLQASPAQMTWLRGDRGPKTAGVSGPNKAMTSIGVKLA